MFLHLLVPFRTHFKLYDEEIIYNPEHYTFFWNQAKEKIQNKDYGFNNISLLHASPASIKTHSRFRTVDQNSLERPLEVICFIGKPNDVGVKQLFSTVRDQLLDKFQLIKEVELITESLIVKLFNN